MNLSLGPTPFWIAATNLHHLADAAPKLSATKMMEGLESTSYVVETGISELESSFALNADAAYDAATQLLDGIDALSTKIDGSAKVSQSQATVDALEGLARLAEGAGAASHSL